MKHSMPASAEPGSAPAAAIAGQEVSLFQVLHAARAIEGDLERALGEHGLSIARYGVLQQLAAAPEPLTLTELAGRLSCVRSNITQLVDRLEADGMVRRVADPVDRRSIRATLTPLGIERREVGAETCERVQREFSARIDADERAAVLRALSKLA